jgi:hypothetical protein
VHPATLEARHGRGDLVEDDALAAIGNFRKFSETAAAYPAPAQLKAPAQIGHFRTFSDMAISLRSKLRTQRSRPLPLRSRCALVMTNAQRAGAKRRFPKQTARKFLAIGGFYDSPALRFFDDKRAARDLRAFFPTRVSRSLRGGGILGPP